VGGRVDSNDVAQVATTKSEIVTGQEIHV
jgi:hypothetical protein